MEMLFTHVQLQDFPVLKIIEWLKWKKSFFSKHWCKHLIIQNIINVFYTRTLCLHAMCGIRHVFFKNLK